MITKELQNKLVTRCQHPRTVVNKYTHEPVVVSCGCCPSCVLRRSAVQTNLLTAYSAQFRYVYFVTLTYAPDFLPEGGTLVRKHVQDFLKRLRDRFSDQKIRVFYCGEYGENFSRPHYHLCLFNCTFKDGVRWFSNNGNWIYRSKLLEELWPFGNSSFSDFTFETAAYVARYCTKKISGSLADEHYAGRLPEFCGMSLKPGIGSSWFDKYGESDLFPHDNVIVRGARCKPPRYYDKLRDRVDPDGLAKAKQVRQELADECADDNTFSRLRTRLKCMQSRTRLLVRKLESENYKL